MQLQAAPGRTRARRQRGAAARAAPEANAGAFQCPTNMNTVPHPRETRLFFYEDVSRSVLAAVAAHEAAAPSGGGAGLRAKAKVEIPELNTSGDTYRIGTLLEMVRHVATDLANDGKRVRVCVQGSMGKGVFQALPIALSGARRVMELMDCECTQPLRREEERRRTDRKHPGKGGRRRTSSRSARSGRRR